MLTTGKIEELFLLLIGQNADPATTLEEKFNDIQIHHTAGLMKKLFLLFSG